MLLLEVLMRGLVAVKFPASGRNPGPEASGSMTVALVGIALVSLLRTLGAQVDHDEPRAAIRLRWPGIDHYIGSVHFILAWSVVDQMLNHFVAAVIEKLLRPVQLDLKWEAGATRCQTDMGRRPFHVAINRRLRG